MNTLPNEKIKNLVNEQCREQASRALNVKDFAGAMRWYNSAAARTIGHSKTDHYRSLAKLAARDGGLTYYPREYATDADFREPGDQWLTGVIIMCNYPDDSAEAAVPSELRLSDLLTTIQKLVISEPDMTSFNLTAAVKK